MSVLLCRARCRLLFVFVLILCIALPNAAMAMHLKDDSYTGIKNLSFSMLILGDSQMAGKGWEGGYANCILEAYPNANVLNLAQNGSMLAKGDIHAQLEFYLSEGFSMPDFILLDGGINDLPYLQQDGFEDTGMSMLEEALCSLLEEIHELSPDTRVIYILMPPLEEWKDSENGPLSYAVQEHYWKQMNIIANTYDFVTVLDLFSINPFCYPCAECYRENFVDSVHLGEAGYRNTFVYIDNILIACLANKLAA